MTEEKVFDYFPSFPTAISDLSFAISYSTTDSQVGWRKNGTKRKERETRSKTEQRELRIVMLLGSRSFVNVKRTESSHSIPLFHTIL